MNSYKEDIQAIYDLDLPWSKLSKKNILVTGSTGLIGSCLIETLMDNPRKDYVVYAAGRNKERAEKLFSDYVNDKNFHFFQYDVTKPIDSDNHFDFIVHCASNASPNFFANKPVEVMKANLEGTINLIEYGLSHGMKRMLYVSSGEIYGEGDGRAFTEDYSGYVNPMKSRSCYPSSKRAAETLCASYCDEYDADIVVARPSHVYGPHFTESDNRVYAQFIRNALNGENIVLKSEGKAYRSWTYVVDCVYALITILLKGKIGEAYNVADELSNITIWDLAELVAEIAGCKVIYDIPDNQSKGVTTPITRAVFDNTKIKQLGWKPLCTLKEGMKHTITF